MEYYKRDWSIIFDWISAPALCIVVILADFYSNGNFPCSSDLSKIMVRHEAACQSLGSSLRMPSSPGDLPGFRSCISFATP